MAASKMEGRLFEARGQLEDALSSTNRQSNFVVAISTNPRAMIAIPVLSWNKLRI